MPSLQELKTQLSEVYQDKRLHLNILLGSLAVDAVDGVAAIINPNPIEVLVAAPAALFTVLGAAAVWNDSRNASIIQYQIEAKNVGIGGGGGQRS